MGLFRPFNEDVHDAINQNAVEREMYGSGRYSNQAIARQSNEPLKYGSKNTLPKSLITSRIKHDVRDEMNNVRNPKGIKGTEHTQDLSDRLNAEDRRAVSDGRSLNWKKGQIKPSKIIKDHNVIDAKKVPGATSDQTKNAIQKSINRHYNKKYKKMNESTVALLGLTDEDIEVLEEIL
jgi:hypothetical protein